MMKYAKSVIPNLAVAGCLLVSACATTPIEQPHQVSMDGTNSGAVTRADENAATGTPRHRVLSHESGTPLRTDTSMVASAAQQPVDVVFCDALFHSEMPLSAIEQAIVAGASVNAQCVAEDGTAAKAIFLVLDYEDHLDLLIKHRVDVNVRNAAGETPLAIALKKRNITAVEKLLAAGASAAGLTLNHVTAFYYEGHYLSIIDGLSAAGIDKAVHARGIERAVCYALSSRQSMESYYQDSTRLVDFSKARCRTRLADGESIDEPAMFKAIRLGADVKPFIADGFDVNAKSNHMTALDVALDSKHIRAIEALLQAGVSPNREDEYGLTPLVIALKNQDTELVKLLVRYGARAEGLGYDLVKYLYAAGDHQTIAEMKAVGLNRKLDGYASVLSEYDDECQRHAFVGQDDYGYTRAYWQPVASFGDDPFVLKFFMNKYRDCLESAFYAAKNQAGYPLQYDEHSVKPTLSRGVMHPALIKSLLATSYLTSSDRKDQHPSKAINLMNESYYELSSALDQAQFRLNQYADERVQNLGKTIDELRAQLRQEVKRLSGERDDNKIDFLIDEALLAADGVVLDGRVVVGKTKQDLPQLVASYDQEISRLDEQRADLLLARVNWKIDVTSKQLIPPLAEPSQQWGAQGMRLTLPRFGKVSSTLHAQAGALDHSRYLVRLNSDYGNCSGVIIGPGVVLTAQRCVMKNGEVAKHVAAYWDYLSVDEDGLSPQLLKARGQWRVKTSQLNHEESWKNDWAVLTLDVDKTALPDWLQAGMSLVSKSEFAAMADNYRNVAVTMAGYTQTRRNQYITMDWGCEIAFRPSSLLTQQCRGWKGDAGAPYVIANGVAKGKIVGVHAYTFQDKLPDSPSSKYNGGGATVKEILSQVNAGSVREFIVDSK